MITINSTTFVTLGNVMNCRGFNCIGGVAESNKTAKRSQFDGPIPPVIWKIPAKKYLVSSSWGHLALFGFDPVYNEFLDVYLKELLAQT